MNEGGEYIMTEQLQTDRRTKAQIAESESFLKRQLELAQVMNPTLATEVVVEEEPRARKRVSRATTQRTAGAVGVLGILGVGVLAGAAIFGGHDAPVNPGTGSSTKNPALIGGTPTPGKSEAGASPSDKTEGTFVPKETAEGFSRASLELLDGTTIDVDRLDYKPGKSISLLSGAVIDGDTSLDNKWTTDSDAQSGSRILNQKDGAILSSLYGLTVYENFDPKYTDQVMKAVENNQTGHGCGLKDGCKVSIAQIYTADGGLKPYDASKAMATEPTPTPDATAGATPCPTVTPEPTPTPMCSCGNPEPHVTCVPGYDHDLANKYNGNLTALKKDVKNHPDNKDIQQYVEVVKPGEKVAIQGDVTYVKDGVSHNNFDSDGSTGALTYISIPEGGDKVTVYMVNGGDFHRLATCSTEAEAKELIHGDNGYFTKMVQTYGKGNVTEYDVK